MLTMTPYFIQLMLQLWQVDHCFLCTVLFAYSALVLAGKAEGGLAGQPPLDAKLFSSGGYLFYSALEDTRKKFRYWGQQRWLPKSEASPKQSRPLRKDMVKSRFSSVLKNSRFPKKISKISVPEGLEINSFSPSFYVCFRTVVAYSLDFCCTLLM